MIVNNINCLFLKETKDNKIKNSAGTDFLSLLSNELSAISKEGDIKGSDVKLKGKDEKQKVNENVVMEFLTLIFNNLNSKNIQTSLKEHKMLDQLDDTKGINNNLDAASLISSIDSTQDFKLKEDGNIILNPENFPALGSIFKGLFELNPSTDKEIFNPLNKMPDLNKAVESLKNINIINDKTSLKSLDNFKDIKTESIDIKKLSDVVKQILNASTSKEADFSPIKQSKDTSFLNENFHSKKEEIPQDNSILNKNTVDFLSIVKNIKSDTDAVQSIKTGVSEQLQVMLKEKIESVLSKENLNTEKITIKLFPKKLGIVEIEIKNNNGKINLDFKTENSLTKDIISSSLGTLRKEISNNNIQIDKMNCETGNFNLGSNSQQSGKNPENQNAPNFNAYYENNDIPEISTKRFIQIINPSNGQVDILV